MDFQTHFYDYSDHNSSTTFEQIKKFIHWMYAKNLFTKGVIPYDTTYGCSKQNRYENVMCQWYILVFTHIVIIDRRINSSGHGRKIYVIHGYDKSYLRQKNFMIGT